MFRPVKTYLLAIDVVVACAAFLLRLSISGYELAMVAVVFGMAVVVAIHRLSPTLALIVAWATVAFQLSLMLPPDISNAAILVMLFATSAYGSRALRWVGLVSAGVGALIASSYFVLTGFITEQTGQGIIEQVIGNLPRLVFVGLAGFVGALVLFVLSWTLGLLYRTLIESRARGLAAQQARLEAQRAESEVAIEQERNRIARDMHDVVAHSLAVVIAQADGARYAMKVDAAAADEALSTISATAREALGDVRLLLSQLRHSQGEVPQPVLADLDRLFEQLRSSGLEITRSDAGEPLPLGTGQQLAVYRIVQESLTNALRHGAEPKLARVRFEWDADGLEVEIANAFAGPVSTGGHGVAGMRERAVLAGGSLSAEPRDGAFFVTAEIPVIA